MLKNIEFKKTFLRVNLISGKAFGKCKYVNNELFDIGSKLKRNQS